MKKAFFAVLFLITASSAFAGYTPVAGSCTNKGMGEGLCSCDLKGSIDGSIVHSDNVSCDILHCSDFQDAQGCGGMQTATCELSSRSTSPPWTAEISRGT